MTVQEQQRRELLHRETLMQAMINASFDPMFQIDQRGVICVVNDAACNLFGYSRAEFLNHNISIICGGGHAEKHASYLQRYLETGQKKVIGRKRRVPARRKDGTEFDVELGIQEVVCRPDEHGAGEPEHYFCGYVRDLTLEQMNKKLLKKKSSEIRGHFFGKSMSEGGDEDADEGEGGDDAGTGGIGGRHHHHRERQRTK